MRKIGIGWIESESSFCGAENIFLSWDFGCTAVYIYQKLIKLFSEDVCVTVYKFYLSKILNII